MTGNLWREKNKTLSCNKKQEIIDLINKINPDLLIIGHYRSLWLSTFINHPNTWYWIHGDIICLKERTTKNAFRYLKEKRRYNIERRLFCKLLESKNIIVVNEDLKNLFSQHLINANIKCIHNGINTARLKSSTSNNIEKIWDTIFVGRLSPEKQPELALQAFADSSLTGRMAIVGEGELISDLKQLTCTLNIEHRVDFLGWQDNPSIFIQQSKSLLLSSKTEGSPLIVAESILLNVPVVAFNCSSGIRYQLNSSELQRGLVEPQNINALTKALENIIHSPYKITESNKEKLTIERMFNDFLDLLKFNFQFDSKRNL